MATGLSAGIVTARLLPGLLYITEIELKDAFVLNKEKESTNAR